MIARAGWLGADHAAGRIGQIQATCIGGSQRTGAYGPQGAQAGCTPQTSCTPGLRTSDGTEERRLWRRTGGRRSYKLQSGGAGRELETSRAGASGGQEQADIEGASTRITDLRRSGQSWDSESRSIRTAGLAPPAGLRHSPAPTGVRRDFEQSRLDWVEGDGDNGTRMCHCGRFNVMCLWGCRI
jgi:hypothetical protein